MSLRSSLVLLANFLCCSAGLCAEPMAIVTIDNDAASLSAWESQGVTSDNGRASLVLQQAELDELVLRSASVDYQANPLQWELQVSTPIKAKMRDMSTSLFFGLCDTYTLDSQLPLHLRVVDNDLLSANNVVQPLLRLKLIF